MDDQRKYVVLKNDEWKKIFEEYVENPESHPMGPAIWHVESVDRYQAHAPTNPHWLLHKVFENQADALAYLEEQHDKEFRMLKTMASKAKRQNGKS